MSQKNFIIYAWNQLYDFFSYTQIYHPPSHKETNVLCSYIIVHLFLFVKREFEKECDILEIRYSKAALKVLSKLDNATRNRILVGIDGLTQKPPIGDIKAMQGMKNEFRLRIGKYRIIYYYTLEGCCEILYIDKIGSRGDIYK